VRSHSDPATESVDGFPDLFVQVEAQKLKPGLSRERAECEGPNAARLEITGDRSHVHALLLEEGNGPRDMKGRSHQEHLLPLVRLVQSVEGDRFIVSVAADAKGDHRKGAITWRWWLVGLQRFINPQIMSGRVGERDRGLSRRTLKRTHPLQNAIR
jgi:hypothetical protein